MKAQAIVPNKAIAASRVKLEETIDHPGAEEALTLTHSEIERIIERDGGELLRPRSLTKRARAARAPRPGPSDRLDRILPSMKQIQHDHRVALAAAGSSASMCLDRMRTCAYDWTRG